MMENTVYFFLLAFVAEVLGTIGGFGSSLFFVPIAGLFFEFHTVLGITALFHVVSNLTKIGFFRKGFDRRLIIAMGIPAVVGVIAGAFFTRFFEARTLELILAIFLISISLILLLFRNLAVRPTPTASVAGGALSGIVAGLLGTGGAIRGIVLTSFGLRMEVFIATSAVIDLAVDTSRSVVYYLNGYIHRDAWLLLPGLLLASVAGTFTGKQILRKVSEQQFRVLVLLLILMTGLVTLGKIIWGEH